MALVEVPPFLPSILGTAADTRDIVDQTPAGSGQVSWQVGFPPITATPLTAGGIAPQREDFNAINKLFSQHIYFQQSGGRYPWQSTLNYIVGCFALGSDGKTYESLAASGPDVPDVGPKNPLSNSDYWRDTTISPSTILGTICMFSGTFGGVDNRYPIPLGTSTPNTNWCICDGVTTNGLVVPDLRNRFIVGSGSDYITGNTGGASSQSVTVSGSVGSTTLSTNQMPSHTHSITDTYRKDGYGGGSPWNGGAWSGTSSGSTGSAGSSWGHSHSFTGTSTTVSTLPPYYALAFIIMIGTEAGL